MYLACSIIFTGRSSMSFLSSWVSISLSGTQCFCSSLFLLVVLHPKRGTTTQVTLQNPVHKEAASVSRFKQGSLHFPFWNLQHVVLREVLGIPELVVWILNKSLGFPFGCLDWCHSTGEAPTNRLAFPLPFRPQNWVSSKRHIYIYRNCPF